MRVLGQREMLLARRGRSWCRSRARGHALDQGGNLIKRNALISQRLDQENLLLGVGIKAQARGRSTGNGRPGHGPANWVGRITRIVG